jgi:hypothetical protein
MKIVPFLLSALTAAASAAAPAPSAGSPPALEAPADEPLACRLDALSPAERGRHQKLTALLERAVVGVRELPGGYELALDLSRLPADAKGDPVCVVEIAEWVDLEARCCPFLDFGIAVRGKGAGSVALALTGGPGVKDFLKMEFSLVEKKLES